MTIQQATQQLTAQLVHVYEKREAGNIAGLVMENITGWKRIDRLLHKQQILPPEKTGLLQHYTNQLLQHRPVQYVLGEAWFYGMKLYVDEHVLIPRPETEELVQWVVQDIRNRPLNIDALKLLDAGTGSGCIAMALKKELPGAHVYACDISEDALRVAGKNASSHDLPISFLLNDFLQPEQRGHLPVVDVLVSNPPYIPLAEQAVMHSNVLQYEPHLALFVADNDPLVFYRAIAGFAHTRLSGGGIVYMEIHENMADDVTGLFHTHGFTHVECRKDLQGKDRMIKVIKE